MSGRIVVGVTQNEAGRRALAWAGQRATDKDLPLLLVTVVGGALGVIGEGAVLAASLEVADEFLTEEAEKLRATGLSVDIEVVQGDPVTQLTKLSAEETLLVIGSDYTGTGKGKTRGVHGVRIAASSAVPVVVVPDIDLDGRSGVVVGVDGSPISAAAILFAAAEADRLGEPLIAVSVWTPVSMPRGSLSYPDDYLKNMETATEETLALSLAGLSQDYPDLEIRKKVVQGYPSRAINEAAETARLAVVGSHGRGTIARFLLGSVGQEVLTHLATATAVVR